MRYLRKYLLPTGDSTRKGPEARNAQLGACRRRLCCIVGVEVPVGPVWGSVGPVQVTLVGE